MPSVMEMPEIDRSKHRRIILAIALICLLSIGVVWAVTIQRKSFEYDEAIANSMAANGNLAIAFEEGTVRTLKGAEQVARFLRKEYLVRGRETDIAGTIRSGVIDDALFTVVSVIDEHGDIILSTLPFTAINYVDRDWYEYHSLHQNDTFYIGKPVLGRVSKKLQIPMSLRIDKPDGSFGGVVVLSVDPEYFTRFYQKANLGAKGSVLLAGTDGITRADRIGAASGSGRDIHGSNLLAEQAKRPVGSYFGQGKIDGVRRIFAYRTLNDYPLIVLVGTAEAEVIAPFLQRKRNYYFAAAAASALILAFGGALMTALTRHRRSQKRLQETLRDHARRLDSRVAERTAELSAANTELTHANAAAESANQAKGAFLASMSHEIRTPMNGVIGMADVLQETSLNDSQVEMVDLIRRSAFSLLTIIGDILDFSKIEAGGLEIERTAISIADVVERACGMLDHVAINKSVEFTLFIDPTIPETVLGDELRLRQVLLNLVSNAIKFSSGREQVGRISVRVVSVEQSPAHVTVEIHVADNGIGMDENAKARLFAAFSQGDASTTRRFGGTGLGLVISRRLVELMGGALTFTSTPDIGSTFTVRLPFASRSDVVVKPASETAGLCCVVVGGPDGLAEHIAAYLTHDGARTERAADPSEARKLMPGLPAGLWIWIIDAGDVQIPVGELRELARSLPEQEIRFVVIGRGSRREPHAKSFDLVAVDGNVLTRRRLFRTVALAAGRARDESHTPLSGKHSALKPPSRDDALRNRRLILVVEDNETNQKVIMWQLALLGFAGDIAANGRLALELWESGDYALLLSDLHMPEMDGYELTAAIRAQELGSRRTPIVALTANALRGEADRCRAVGMDDYLSKPAQLADLKAILDTWLPGVASMGHADGEVQAKSPAPAVDVSVLKTLVGNDPEIIRDLLSDFQLGTVKIAEALTAACAHGQPVRASEQAHKLKSSARSVGALALGELCEEMEMAGNAEGGAEALLALLPMFEHELDAVNAFLDSSQNQAADRRQAS